MSAFVPQPDDGPRIPWALLLFLLPVVARIARAVLEALGLVKPAADAEAAPRPDRRRQREEEDEGADLFERLARGEEPAPVAREQRPEPPRPRPRPVEVSLESESEPEPLSVLGPVEEAREPSEVPEFSLERAAAAEVSLESEAEPAALATLERPAEFSEAVPLPVSSRAFRLLGGDLRRAVLLSEILGPPLSQRALR